MSHLVHGPAHHAGKTFTNLMRAIHSMIAVLARRKMKSEIHGHHNAVSGDIFPLALIHTDGHVSRRQKLTHLGSSNLTYPVIFLFVQTN